MTPALRRVLVWSAVGIAVAAGLAWSFWPRAIPVDVMTVSAGPMQVEVSDEGRTRAREVYQVSAPVAGRLLRVEEHAGDQVIGGKTVVADLLPTAPGFLDIRSRAQAEAAVKSAEAARAQAAAEVEKARAQRNFAKADLDRANKLYPSNIISRADFERAQTAHDTATAQLATTEAALKAKEFDLQTARAVLIGPSDLSGAQRQRASIALVAPVSGRILRVLHENESVIAAGTPIMEIGDPKQLEILVQLISEDAVKVHEGDRARITDWGGPGELAARVRRVEPSGFTKVSALGVEEQRVNVLLDFTDPPAKWASIKDGFRVTTHIVIWQKPNVLRLPASAMFRQGHGWAAFSVRNGKAVLTKVEVGKSNDEYAELLGGLKAGDKVIVHPSDRIRDGTSVTF